MDTASSTAGTRCGRSVRNGERRHLGEIALVLGLILGAVWTPPGRLNRSISMVAALMIANLAVRGPSTPAQLGLSHPLRGAAPILLSGAILCGVILLMGSTVRFAGAGHGLPWDRSWQYLIWALAQEFILQSTFYVRLEMIFAPRHASLIAAGLFSLAHIPSPVLTLLSFVGGFFFSWLFGRFRNLYALGAIHGALGLTIASCLPDAWLHHMRVGLGYLTHS